MANNLTIESPNFEKINKEAGQFTADAIALLWWAMNQTRKEERTHFRLTRDMLRPKVLQVSASASVDNLDLNGCSVVEFTGSSAQNLTGFQAPDTGTSQIVIVSVTGSGTITAKHNVTSESTNRLYLSSGSDVTLTTGNGIIFAYLSGLWREVA